MSFTLAAEELNYTQSAVSNHVRSLEEFIGRPLFVRFPRSLALTDVGEAYLPTIRHALQEIDLATQSLLIQTHKQEIVISCPYSLAANWLPEVIRQFKSEYPNVDLTVHGTTWTDVDDNVSDVSISIAHIDEVKPGVTRLWNEVLTVVCAPDYQVNGKPISTVEDFLESDLIHILGRLEYWSLVFESFNLQRAERPVGLRTNATLLALELAVQGLGCAAVPRSLALSFLDRGQLIEPLPIRVGSPWVYCLSAKDAAATPIVRIFLDWLHRTQNPVSPVEGA